MSLSQAQSTSGNMVSGHWVQLSYILIKYLVLRVRTKLTHNSAMIRCVKRMYSVRPIKERIVNNTRQYLSCIIQTKDMGTGILVSQWLQGVAHWSAFREW